MMGPTGVAVGVGSLGVVGLFFFEHAVGKRKQDIKAIKRTAIFIGLFINSGSFNYLIIDITP